MKLLSPFLSYRYRISWEVRINPAKAQVRSADDLVEIQDSSASQIQIGSFSSYTFFNNVQWLCIKVNVNLPLCLIKYHFVKMHGKMEVQLHTFITAVLDGHNWSASRISFSSQVRKTRPCNGWETVWTVWWCIVCGAGVGAEYLLMPGIKPKILLLLGMQHTTKTEGPIFSFKRLKICLI